MAKVAINGGKVVIKGGRVACSCCCPTTLPGWQYDSRGLTKTKGGYQGYNEDGSPNGEYYLTKTEVHTWTLDRHYQGSVGGSNYCCSVTHEYQVGNGTGTRVSTFDPATNSFTEGPYPEAGSYTDSFTLNYYRTDYLPEVEVDCSEGDNSGSEEVPVEPFLCPFFTSVAPEDRHIALSYTLTSATERRWVSVHIDNLSGPPPCPSGSKFDFELECVLTTTVSDPYTTLLLVTTLRDALPAWDNDFDDTAGAYRNLSPDEMSYSERQAKARLPLAGLGMVDGRTYHAVYVVRFTPLVGDPVDGDEQILAVEFVTGMTHSTPIDIPVPEANGTNIPVLLRWECPEDEE